MKVLQIITGKIPSRLIKCIDTVRSYAKKIGAEYVCKSGIDHGNYLLNRAQSDIDRCKYLSENPCTLYCDWDIYLKDDFKIEDISSPMFFYKPKECMIYNGYNIEMFKDIYNSMRKEPIENDHALLKSIRIYCFDKQINYGIFTNAIHYCNSKEVS